MRFFPTAAYFFDQAYSLYRILTFEPNIARLFRNILRQPFFRFQQDALELSTERHVNFLIFRSFTITASSQRV
jgi:hypothetical protein